MRNLFGFFLLLYLLIVNGLHLKADPAEPFFLQHYDNRNGLSNSSINHIFKDAGNMLWVATWDGLNMYDGTAFHVFNYSKENDFKSIGSNVIQTITQDKRNNIWISTIEGISRYEKRTGKFYNYFYNQYQRSNISEQEYALAVDTAGTVFCLNKKTGLTYYDAVADSFKSCNLPQQSSNIIKLAFDESNFLWLLNSNGQLDICKGTANRFKLVFTCQQKKKIVNFFPLNHELFFSTEDDQLFSVNSTTLIQKPLLQMPHSLSAMIFYKDHYLLAWSVNGSAVFNNEFKFSTFLSTETKQLQDIKITCWALGTEDILWYGTDGNGVIKVYPKTKSFGTVATSDNGMPYNKSVRAFCEENGNLWVGTKGSGIIKIPNFWLLPDVGFSKEYFTAPSVLDNNAVYALKKGNDGLVYIGTDARGIGVYNEKNKKFTKWSSIKGTGAWPVFGSVYAILQDADSSLWMGTSGYGLIHLKINADANGMLSLAFLERFMFNNSNSGPANDIIYALANGGEDQLWIGCRYGGLSLLHKKSKNFKTFKAFTYDGSLSNNDVLSVFKDSRNRIWVGTSYGLNWINNADALKEAPVFQKITTANGLPNNTIHAIEEDRAGHIWVSTNKGLAKVNQDNLKVSYYQQTDGLQSNEFCDGAVWKDRKDNLYFGGTYGFNSFLPQNIRKTTWLPNLLLSIISMGEKATNENGFIVVTENSNEPLDFAIGRKDNFFELDVNAISFLNASKCEFAYYLNGYDKNWHIADNQGKIAYSNILPGNYHLKIKWSNGEGTWSQEIPLLNLKVKQYFWLNEYALLVYLLLLATIFYTFYSYRKNKLAIKHQLEVEHLMRTKEEDIHQNRLGFFTNIAHELQTPLTLIMGSSERFLDKTVTNKSQKDKSYFLSLIYQQASKLTYLVHQLLEFRKVEAGFFKNQFSYFNIAELLNNLAEPFTTLGEQQQIKYTLEIYPDMQGWVDKDKIEKIIFNLLSNAFKYAGKNEQIIFTANENTGTRSLEISIANSGIQIPSNQLDQLFDQFYSASQNTIGGDKFGTGIGLAFTRQLVTLLNGSITAASKNGWVTFQVCLPLSVPPPEDVINNKAISNQPSYLYQTITSYNDIANKVSAQENNKEAIIENLTEQDKRIVLIVEDDLDIRFLLKDLLKNDYVVYEAADGQKALEVIATSLPDIVICDVMMPNMNGLELCNAMKNATTTCQIPFILLSARGSEDHRMEGYEVGADAYIAKPFNTAHLKIRIRKLLEYHQKLHNLFKENTTEKILDDAEIPDGDKAFLMKMVKIITEKLDEPELSATLLEKEFCLSKMQLYRKLKTLTGMTPGEFIRHLRLKQAAHLLINTNYNVSEIFFKTGFNNQSYFFREFKKRYNCAPNEYRSQQNNPLFPITGG